MKLLFMSVKFYLCAVRAECMQKYFDFRISRRIARAQPLCDIFTLLLSKRLCAAKLGLKKLRDRIEYEILSETINQS